jgi:hypothetical protein
VTLSSEPPSPPVPSTGPLPPSTATFQGVPTPDDRVLQLPQSPISGPLRGITGTLAGNDFPVSAFLPADEDPRNQTCNLWFIIDSQISGYNLQNTFNYNYHCGPFPPGGPCDPVAAQPGWSQSSGRATVVYLGIPSQPPPGFSF